MGELGICPSLPEVLPSAITAVTNAGGLVGQEHPSDVTSTSLDLLSRPSASVYASIEKDLPTAPLSPGEKYLVSSGYHLSVNKTHLRSQKKQLFIAVASTNPN